jgi:outer membrane receptor protein involved in Fe transport
LTRIPLAQVERIDLIRGGAPGIDMQGKTVVANVIRKTGEGLSGIVQLDAYWPSGGIPIDPGIHLEGTWREGGRVLSASFSVGTGHQDVQGSGRHDIFGPTGQLLDFSRGVGRSPVTAYRATAAYETPMFGGKFWVNFALHSAPLENLNVDNFHVAGRKVEHDHHNQTDLELGQHYERDLASGLGLEILGLEHVDTAISTSVFDTVNNHQDFRLPSHGGELIGRSILHWQPSSALNVDAGGEFAYTWLRAATRFSDNGVPIHVPAADVFIQEKRGEAFTVATWRPLTSLAVEAGVRIEQSTISSSGDVVLSKPLTFLKPRLLTTWSPDAADQVRVRVEREVGQLDFSNFVANAALNGVGVVAGNPNLSPQRDWAFEAAYDRHFWDSGVVSLTVRHLFLQGVVDRVPVFAPSGVFDEPGNIGSAAEDDLVASFNLPLDRLGLENAVLRGLGTWRFSQVTDPTTKMRRAISGQHPLDAELHFSDDIPRWNITWGVDGIFGYRERFFRFNEIDTNRTGDFTTVFVEYKPLPDLFLKYSLDTESHTFESTRQVFGGPRSTNPLQLVDFQDHKFGLVSYVEIRKSFD